MTDRRWSTLRVGGDADIVGLDRDILVEDPSDMGGTRVALTVAGGEIVHQREELA
jgi:predicted amidohydrolase YtcJ